MNWLVLLAIAGVMVALRLLTRLNILVWMIIWWVACFVALKYAIEPPLPASIVAMFMGILTLALLAYLTSSTEYMTSAREALVRFVVDRRYTLPLVLVLVGLPGFVAWNVYSGATRAPQPPVFGRTIHPPPPEEITFRGKTINLVEADNPFRPLKETDPEAFQQHVQNGRRVYYQNCVFCHGDDMRGRGIFAHGFDPLPANFQDPTTIAMLQEAYLFWRIAKGGPGLPDEATPWLSAMPAWEKFLTEEEIWDVILFLYEYTGHKPRAKEEVKK
ncbi:MAG: cytochrome c [Calditrichaeota bacterium]|nr:MAG: cytochrome c [Calditrichota bacterium]